MNKQIGLDDPYNLMNSSRITYFATESSYGKVHCSGLAETVVLADLPSEISF
jgi:hypothetical protein